MRWIAAWFSLVACVARAQTTASANCPGMTTLEINVCVQAELDQVDGLLNQGIVRGNR
jgi:uncharacterized protein YecT (DUF1311 family)